MDTLLYDNNNVRSIRHKVIEMGGSSADHNSKLWLGKCWGMSWEMWSKKTIKYLTYFVLWHFHNGDSRIHIWFCIMEIIGKYSFITQFECKKYSNSLQWLLTKTISGLHIYFSWSLCPNAENTMQLRTCSVYNVYECT